MRTLTRFLLCFLMLAPLPAIALDREMVEDMLRSQEGIAGLKRFEAVIDGHKVSYLDNGRATAGRTVMFVHGFGDSSASWMFFARSFRDGDYRVIIPDLLGFGRSARPAAGDYGYAAQARRLLLLMEKLQVKSAHLVGNSMGGGVVAQMSLLRPDAVASLTLMDSAGVHFKATELDQQVLKGNNFLIPKKPEDFERLLDYVAYRRPVMTRPIIDYLADRAVKDAPLHERIFYEVLIHDVGFLTLALADIKAPTLILWGEKDRVLHPDNARVFNRYIPGSRLHYFPEAGHVPMAEIPDESALVVTRFIDGLYSGR
ncbi:MAG: abhd6-B [Moraxellaceae bacterium]|jgi:pimeloyl-ACP methyl ester carboxylesterase|nr:abhd6-B [Moraxellaceae bacterium]